MLSDAQRALIAARLRRGRPDPDEDPGPGAVRPGRSGPLVELAAGGADGVDGAHGEPAGRLFLVHAIGGTVHPYAPLAAQLGPQLAVLGIEAAGLAPGAEPAASLEAMAAAYLAAIRAAQPAGGPYLLSGWSMGGLVAYELARRLERAGEKVEALVLLDPPFAMPADPARAGSGIDGGSVEGRIAGWFLADALRTLGPGTGPGAAPAEPPPDPAAAGATEQLDWLARRLTADPAGPAATAAVADAVRAEIGRRFAVFEAHTRLIAGYRPSAALQTRTLLVSARQSPNAAVAAQWLALLGPAATAHFVDADHYAFLRPPLVAGVAARIRDWRGAQ